MGIPYSDDVRDATGELASIRYARECRERRARQESRSTVRSNSVDGCYERDSRIDGDVTAGPRFVDTSGQSFGNPDTI